MLLAGVGLSGMRVPPATTVILSLGLAGGLSRNARPGTVVIPSEVAFGDERVRCDPAWSMALATAAQRLGLPLSRAPLLSSTRMITGSGRELRARQGFDAVDMETGLLARHAGRIAAVRVVLDSPEHELSPRWRHPALAALDPRLWGEARWIARHAPVYARRAAMVLASALADGDVDTEV